MRFFFLLYFLLLSSGIFAAEIIVPEDYNTIQMAIDNCKEGDIIKIATGTYNEAIHLKSNVTLVGISKKPGTTVIKATSSDIATLTCNKCESVQITNITFKKDDLAMLSQEQKVNICLAKIIDSKVNFQNCIFTDGESTGVRIEGKSECVLNNCLISNCKASGFYITGEQAKANILNSIFKNNLYHGISVTQGAFLLAENNKCLYNSSQGIAVFDVNTNVKLTNNTCNNNNLNGIYVYGGANAQISNNNCEENSYNGISITGNGTIVDVTKNTCVGNKGNGVWFGDNCKSEVVSNVSSYNKFDGFRLADSESKVHFKNNVTEKNGRCGFYVPDLFSATFEDNIWKDNSVCSKGYVRDLFKNEKYDQLENIVACLKKNKSRNINGEWSLDFYYCSLGNGWAGVKDISQEQLSGQFNKWAKQFPQSSTPLIALAKLHLEQGQASRGSAWASEVTEEGWSGLKINIDEASELLQKALILEPNNPAIFATNIDVDLYRSCDINDLEKHFQAGIKIQPDYYPLYYSLLNAKQPKWLGKEGDMEKFSDYAIKLTEGIDGHSIYARMVSNLFINIGPWEILKYHFDYSKVKKGFKDILTKWPDSTYYLNSFCYFASIYEDYDTAIKLFYRIGNNWDSSVWYREFYFNKYKNIVMQHDNLLD